MPRLSIFVSGGQIKLCQLRKKYADNFADSIIGIIFVA